MQRNFNLVIRCVFFLGLMGFFSQGLSFSEEHVNDLLPASSAKKRPVDLDKISETELKFLSTQFFRADESILKKYENKEKKPDTFLPVALTKALSNESDESMMARVLAELTGSLNKKQIETLKETAQSLAQQIRASDPQDRDDRYLALVERAEWIGHIIAGEIPPSESLPTIKEEQAFAKFKKEFIEAYQNVAKENRKVLEKIELAKTDSKAKQWLRDRLDTASFADFMRGQKQSGGDQLFQDVAESVVWKDDVGQKYHDFVQSEGQGKRIYVGKSAEENAKALGDYLLKKPNPLKGFSLSSQKIDPEKAEVVNLTKGPIISAPPPPPAPAPQATPPAQTQSAPVGSLTRAVSVFTQKCRECHINNHVNMRDLPEAVQRMQSRGSERMPPAGAPALTPDEKAALIQFFDSGEPKTPFFEAIR